MPGKKRQAKTWRGGLLALAATFLLFAALNPSSAQEDSATISVERLIERADALFGQRDIASARLLYELAASKGSARAAALLGATYDPDKLLRMGVQSRFADADLAADFYREAVVAGYNKASLALKRLTGEEVAPSPAPAAETQIAALPEAEVLDFKTTAGGRFWVQLASLPSQAAAGEERERLAAALAGLVGGLDLALKRRDLEGGKTRFGVQAGPFGRLAEARDFCEALKARRQDCFVIP